MNDNAEPKKYVFYGKRDEVIPSIVNHLNLMQYLEGKDIGAIVGERWENLIWKRFKPLTIDFLVNKSKYSPFANKGSGSRAYIQVPFIDKSKITYDSVRNALAPASWGMHTCILHIQSREGHRGFIKTRGSTENDAVLLARNLHKLTETEILKVEPTEARAEGIYAPNSYLFRPKHKLYPHKMFISNQDLTEAEKVKGNRLTRPTEIPLYYDTEPEWVKLKIRDALRRGDNDN